MAEAARTLPPGVPRLVDLQRTLKIVIQSESPLGRLLQSARQKRGLSQRKAAELVGISDTWLRWIEKGSQPHRDGTSTPVTPGVETCFALADALELDPADVLGLAGHDRSTPRPAPPIPNLPRPENDVVDAILSDRRLLPEARAHLANQYALLLRLQPNPTPPADNDEQEQREQAKYDQSLLDDLDKEDDLPDEGQNSRDSPVGRRVALR